MQAPRVVEVAVACLVCNALGIPALSRLWVSSALAGEQEPALMVLMNWV